MSPTVAGGGLSGSPAFPQRPTSGSPIARRPSRGHSERAVGDGTGPVPPPNYVAGGAIGGRMSGGMLRRGSMAIGSNAAPRGVGYGELSDAEETVSKLAAFSPAILLAQLATPPDPAGVSPGPSPASGHSADATAPWAPSAWQFESAVLFVDVSGFTNLCTRLDVDALQRHINRYFTRLLDVVHTHGGDVLRFMGDAMLVTWALPLHDGLDVLAYHLRVTDLHTNAVETLVLNGDALSYVYRCYSGAGYKTQTGFPYLDSRCTPERSYKFEVAGENEKGVGEYRI